MLSPAQLEFRKRLVGGSDANTIMSGDAERIIRLWQEKRGEVEPEELSDVLPVQMGAFTEPFNREWFEKHYKNVWGDGEECLSLEYPFMGCTLDGRTLTAAGHEAIWEAKHVSAFAKPDEIRARYLPQVMHNMIVTNLEWGVLSVFFGTLKHEVFEIELDHIYAEQLIEAERAFWRCVETGEAPVAIQVAAPKPTTFRTVDMQGSNEWGEHAATYLETLPAVKRHDKALVALKDMIEPDVGHAFGCGIQFKRAKDNSLRVSQMKE